jgi:hypothetical protein
MLWLETGSAESRPLYFDVQQVEERQFRGRSFYAVTGVCGDELWEGEVLIEVGAEATATFVDDWLAPGRLAGFFLRHDRAGVETALIQALTGARFCLESFPAGEGNSRRQVVGLAAGGRWLPLRPRTWAEQLELPLAVAEGTGAWSRHAA